MTKKSLCVNGVSQSWMGRKQAEKATLLETWTLSSEIGRMTQRMEPGALLFCVEDYFQGAELFSNQAADDLYQADFTTAVALLGAFCVTPHPHHLLNSSVSYNPIPGLLQWGRYVIF